MAHYRIGLNRGAFGIMKHTRKEKGEMVGGGYFVFRRGRSSGRIKINVEKSPVGIWLPFEHASVDSAIRQAENLQAMHLNTTFCVLQQVYQTKAPTPPKPAPGDF